MAIVEAKGVRKVYRGDGVETEALRGVSLAVEKGEFTALVGPSGSGKSTLLHILAGLDLPTEGEVYVGGVRLDRLGRSARARFRLERIGLVFQAYNLLPVLTALENAAFVLELRGVPKGEREKRALEALAALGLKDKAHRFPRQLSGGEQQRVAVARALAAEPVIVLADEPTANLDSRTGLALIERMKALNEVQGVTFLFSTHDPRLLEHVRRVVRLEDGRIVGEEVR
ncbi:MULTISPECIES: ABC transporter ATP-binding protein [Thermus]|jgi:putative ABC transport system ATP-binding protein|uniref:ABC transporter ATP-binding protein n=1 Tax=Thermus brockianus TaxID=56956 RepID=A0A1J0LSA8_THEBO|nr:ABC transporter ATP-binding protein [Thermus brockianus]APD08357.1 ABC transporter ATP-binding protein [Thermus brockianus]BDG16298.1 macrolide ABC transporter ATP-binding protein [Thermus brockianus]